MKHALCIAISVALLSASSPPASAAPKRSATVKWTPVENVTGYRLYFGRASRSYPQSVTVSGTTYHVGGLTRGVRYYFAVKAVKGTMSSVYSGEKTYTPQ